MPQNITDVDTFTATVQTPASGEPRTAASVKTPVQGLADRTRWLYNRALDRIGVASSAALKALAAPADGVFRIVTSAGALGLYRFRAGTPLGADYAPFVYDANDGSGYWEHLMARLMVLGGYGGNQPRLDTGTIRVPNSIVGVYVKTETGSGAGWIATTIPPAGDWPDFHNTTFVSDAVNLAIGDIVLVRASFGLQCDDQACWVQLGVDTGTVAPIPGTSIPMFVPPNVGPPLEGATVPCTLSGHYIATSAGSHAFRVRVASGAGDTVSLFEHRRIELLVIKP